MIFLFILILFSFPLSVTASSSYLTELNIQNGTLLTPFNMQNNLYTIRLDEEALEVEFTYTLESSSAHIEIIDNKFEEEKENIMIIKVTNEENQDMQTYTFFLEKEKTQETLNMEDTTAALNITKKERSPFLAPTIIITCAILISILFYFLVIRFFKKRKN